MYKTVKEVFDDHCSGISIDNKLCEKIALMKNNFITKNPDHAGFFGGNLTGVHVVRFTNNDRARWFEEILQYPESELTHDLNQLIDPNYYVVAGDVFNLSCVWLSHAIRNSTKINDKKKREAESDIYKILQFRFITSRLQRHWPYPASKEVAEATLASMSNKFDIKRKGSWISVITDRADDIVDPVHSIHRLTINRMQYDIRNKGESVGYLLTDTQGRNKALLKNIYNQQKIVQEQGFRIASTSATFVELDGEVAIKDKQKSLETYRNYLFSIISDKPSFIKLELVEIIEKSNKTMPPQMFRETLSYISNLYGKNSKDKTNVDDVIDRLMNHLISYLYLNRNVMKNKSDIAGLISRMKGIYTSSRTSDELLLSIRQDLENIVRQATKNKSGPAVAATRTGIMLYIVLRAFTMKHYQS